MIKRVDSLPERTRGSRGVDWKQTCLDVEAEGGAWCEIGDFHSSTASHIRVGRYPSVDPTRFEVTTQRSTTDPKKSTLYMRLRV
jgi:hypothetical protein